MPKKTLVTGGSAGAAVALGLAGSPWPVYLIVVTAGLVMYLADQYVRLRLGEKVIAKTTAGGLPTIVTALFPSRPDDRAGGSHANDPSE